jgi:hypothetical protein
MIERVFGPWGLVFVGLVSVTGCRGTQPPPDATAPPLAASATGASGVSLSGTSGEVGTSSTGANAASPRALDERWQRAQGEDLADKQALADTLGAAGLLDALDDGGNITLTALLCLPLAEDADIALSPLAQRLRNVANDVREPYLSAILGIAGRPARAREAADPEGATQAAEVLVSIAKNEGLPRDHRALAISAARALAEKKVIDPAKIPTDLDPAP